jgi:hypothetical protein
MAGWAGMSDYFIYSLTWVGLTWFGLHCDDRHWVRWVRAFLGREHDRKVVRSVDGRLAAELECEPVRKRGKSISDRRFCYHGFGSGGAMNW